jgi:hypothetical protein
MIGMVVGNDDPVDIDNVGNQELLAQVRAAIDQQPLAFAFDQDGRTGAAVLRLPGSQLPQSFPIRGTPVDVPQPRIRTLMLLLY